MCAQVERQMGLRFVPSIYEPRFRRRGARDVVL